MAKENTVWNVLVWIAAVGFFGYAVYDCLAIDYEEPEVSADYQPSKPRRLPSIGEKMVVNSEAPASEELPMLIQAHVMLTSLGHERFREHVRAHPSMMTIPRGVPIVILERRRGSRNTTFVRARTCGTSVEYWTILTYLDYPSNR